MASESAEAQLKRLQARHRENKRRINALQHEHNARERKRRSTMLIAYGLVILDELERGTRKREDLMRQLDRILKQPSHRRAVGLPLKDENTTDEKTR